MRPRGLQGSPDFLFAKEKVAVFVDGCFWHGCPKCGHVPRKNAAFWHAKLVRNRERDLASTRELRKRGFSVVRLWEHELRDGLARCIDQISRAVSKSGRRAA